MPIRVGTQPILKMIVGSVSDPDALAFLAATGITDATITSAINTLVVDLKSNSLWTKFNAIYPMVGGTSTTCKYNLIDPRDLDAAFRLTFSAGWTFASTGVTGNGTSTYADTHLAPSTHLGLNDVHLSAYARTSTATLQNVDMGIIDGSNTLYIAFYYEGTSNQNFRAVNASQVGPSLLGVPEPAFYQANRISSTQSKQYRNGSILNTDNVTSGGLSTRNIFLGCFNNAGSPQYVSDREYAFFSIGEGMTDGEASTFYSIVQAFNTTLSRQV